MTPHYSLGGQYWTTFHGTACPDNIDIVLRGEMDNFWVWCETGLIWVFFPDVWNMYFGLRALLNKIPQVLGFSILLYGINSLNQININTFVNLQKMRGETEDCLYGLIKPKVGRRFWFFYDECNSLTILRHFMSLSNIRFLLSQQLYIRETDNSWPPFNTQCRSIHSPIIVI